MAASSLSFGAKMPSHYAAPMPFEQRPKSKGQNAIIWNGKPRSLRMIPRHGFWLLRLGHMPKDALLMGLLESTYSRFLSGTTNKLSLRMPTCMSEIIFPGKSSETLSAGSSFFQCARTAKKIRVRGRKQSLHDAPQKCP